MAFDNLKKFLTAIAGPSNRALRDAVILGALILPVYGSLLFIDAFDRFYEFSRSHEDWELDELVALLFVLGLATAIYALRRHFDLRGEVKKRIVAETRANRLARHDSLTGLPNRRQFMSEAYKILAELGDTEDCAFFIIDLDHFKPINDLHGHRTGDEVLSTVAGRLSDALGGHGLVARLGGDEFGILLRCQKGAATPERIARRIVHEVTGTVKVKALSIKVGCSIGIALARSSDCDEVLQHKEYTKDDCVHRVLRHADMAMYRAKTEGRGQYRFFEKDMDEKLKMHLQLEYELKQAIQSGQVVPYFQQLVDLGSGDVAGYEVLARWHHPKRGLIAPDVFVPIAEDTGLISEMTVSILHQAIDAAKNWPGEFMLSVNLSPRQLVDPWLAQQILGILSATGFPPHRLEVEITESGLVEKVDEAKAVLQSLRNVGIKIALDDFGTGYSGLYHLRALCIDTVKIDRSFVTHMLSNAEESKIVEAVINLSNAMGLTTIAEGIETPEVMDRLKELGCTSGQGYYFGRPKQAEDIRKDLDAQKSAAGEKIARAS